ncbi:hypothetical protein BWD42_13110 [Sphingobacterium sp. CZ-UAM]|uniref:sensor histidine kinase n=1 Tax=Sphingobacterium sp. CZ-UAM TaxID=1933868 RepID=UPI0009856E1F|nr:histidine kinase [Sphingobacterium sp. CZ-UAM]OOG18195.1 hypothetical protein BWD42_13110 [Sphingobacterium sp. CZ-UAM]
MRTAILLFLLFQFFAISAQDSQGNDYYFGDNFHFSGYSTDAQTMVRTKVGYITSAKYIWHIFDSFDNTKKLPGKGLSATPNSPIILGIKLNPKLKNFISPEVQNFSKKYNSYFIPDSSDATIIAMGINKNNHQDFMYRVIENDSIELVPWSPIPALSMSYGAKEPYGDIGTFNFPNKLILVEVKHRKVYNIRDGYILDWRKNVRPILDQIIARGAGQYGYFNLLDRTLNKSYIQQYDKLTGVPLDLTFNKDSISSLNLEFQNHETIPYSINLIKKTKNIVDTILLEWWTQSKQFEVSNQYLNEIGEYELLIHKTGNIGKYGPDEVLRIPYRVTPAPKQFSATFFWSTLFPILCVSIVIIITIFILVRYRSRKRLKKLEQQRQALMLQIRNIQSQLNPHFIFNAINSIQNLIQKTDQERTNYYLSKFSSLTRATLENAEREMNTLNHEFQLLDDYLQMEQLRFGFKYEILNNLEVHGDLIEIPSLLLQPIVENAVKHGIAAIGSQGMITLSAQQVEQDLFLCVSDNGKGFNVKMTKPTSGYGLRLTEERLILLGKLYPENTFQIHRTSNSGITKICIIISDWIAKP